MESTKLRNNWPTLALAVTILALSALGIILRNTTATLLSYPVMCTLITFVVLKKPTTFSCYLALWVISISLLLQTTLVSPYLVGTDVHLEYYYANTTLQTGWNINTPQAQNSALSIVLLAPYLAKTFHIPLLWIFKLVFPLLYSLVPLLVFYMFERQMDRKAAFMSSFLFIAIPTYFTENTSIARQMVSTLPFALCILVLIQPLRVRVKIPLLAALSVSTLLLHYSMGVLLLAYLVIMFGLSVVTRAKVPAATLGIVVAITVASGFLYFSSVASGRVAQHFIWLVGSSYANATGSTALLPGADEAGVVDKEQAKVWEEHRAALEQATEEPGGWFNLREKESLVRTAFGLDFMQVSTLGKVFRVLQYLVQILLVVGTACLVFRRKVWSITPEFRRLVYASVIILLLCVVVPGISSTIGATRFFHTAMLTMSPMFVLGSKALFKRETLALCVLMPYFLFNSGFVFELTKHEDMSRIEIPYSAAVSMYRLDIGGILTHEDQVAADWISQEGKTPIYGDLYGRLVIQERVGGIWGAYQLTNVPELEAKPPIEESYIFLRTWNEENRMLNYWSGPGLRELYSYEESGMDEWLSGREIVFQHGEATVYGKKP